MNILINNFQHKIPILNSKIKSTAQKVARHLHLGFPELSIVFIGSQRMRSMNKKFLGHDYVTDVITFKNGEIIICPSVAAKNAQRHGHSCAKEINLYVIHGLLHLAGYDDHAPGDIKKMRKMEESLL